VVDVPITFRDRVAGESKLTMKQNVLYLQQLLGLYLFKYPATLLLVVAFLLAIASSLAHAAMTTPL
jgi:dolichol-phosphate mannosyltransferase